MTEAYLSGAEAVEWHWLRPHYQREALWVVSPPLPLEEVARAVSSDDKGQVERWLADGVLSRPTAEQLTAWEADAMRKLAMIIVQPFVFVQEALE